MKLIEREGDRVVFRMSAREKKLLERLLSLYPLQSGHAARLSHETGPRWEEANQLLAEASKEQKTELAAWVARRLTEGEAFVASGASWRLVLEGGDVERLLQVLNELRIGSWIKLGRPEDLDAVDPDDTAVAMAPLHWLLVLTGQFQMVLIHALYGDVGPGPDAASPPPS